MKFKLNDEWAIGTVPHNWVLYYTQPGINPKTKKPYVEQSVGFYANPAQCFQAALDKDLIACDSLQDFGFLVEKYNQLVEKIKHEIKN